MTTPGLAAQSRCDELSGKWEVSEFGVCLDTVARCLGRTFVLLLVSVSVIVLIFVLLLVPHVCND